MGTVEETETGTEEEKRRRKVGPAAVSKGKSSRDLRVQQLQTEGELTKVEKEVETIARNEKTNPPVAAQAKEKKKELEKYKLKLKNSLRSILSEQKNRDSKQKLSVF